MPGGGWAFCPRSQDSASSVSLAPRGPVCSGPPAPGLALREYEGAHECPQPLRLPLTSVPDTGVGPAGKGSEEQPSNCV